MADISVREFTYKTSWQGDVYSVQIFGDGAFIRTNQYTEVEPTEQVFLSSLKKSVDENGIISKDGTRYKLSVVSADATISQVRQEWSKYNSDKTSSVAFGEAKSRDISFAKNLAKNDAIKQFGKKQNTQNYTVNGAVITQERLYTDSDGTYTYLLLVQIDALVPDKGIVEEDTGENSAIIDDADLTKFTGVQRDSSEKDMGSYYTTQINVQARANKNGKTYIAGGYYFVASYTEKEQRDIWAKMYQDLAEQIIKDDIAKDTTAQSISVNNYTITKQSFKFITVPQDRPKEKPKENLPPPPTPPLAPKAVRNEPIIYQPKSRVSKPKSTKGGEFVEKVSGKDYKGPYIQAYKNKYYAGSNLDQNGVELVIARTEGLEPITPALALLFASIQGFFKKTASSADIERGATKRYFIQTKRDNKIVEVTKNNYQDAKKALPNQNFAEVDWIIKGPAEDKLIGGYPYKGAESKNREAIQALEKQIPGISTFVTDYKFLVQEPQVQTPLTTQTIVEKDEQVQLDNDRKANFDLRK